MSKTSKKKDMEKKLQLKVMMDEKGNLYIDKKQVDELVQWKVYLDTNTRKLCGKEGYYVAVAAPDESLPQFTNKPHWVEERRAVMLVLK